MIHSFDAPTDRHASGSYKWDSDPSLLPFWVADMDFRTAPCIIEALQHRVEHGIFGYTYVTSAYYKALTDWFRRRHHYSIDPSLVIYTSGVVPAISAVIKALARPADGVIVQTPVYNCFFSSIRNNGCSIIENPLRKIDSGNGTFTYEMDFDNLEEVASRPDSQLLLLCNPGNPSGRLWRKDELERVKDICERHGITVISDEIHCELTAPGSHYVPYGNIDPRAVVCLSPSKAFNTAGLQIANIVCPDETTRAAIDRAININEVCDVNPFGVVALEAAYSDSGERWLNDLRNYLWENYATMLRMIRKLLPEASVSTLEATYLPMIDVSVYTTDTEQLEEILKIKGKVWVNSSDHYGTKGCLRINIACQRTLLEEGIRRIATTINSECSI